MFLDRIKKGRKGEERAEKFLKKKGYRIIDRNYRTRCGEIDIIAVDGDVLVFVEVKSSYGPGFGPPGSRVTERKQRHITLASETYLKAKGIDDDHPVRFDVVAVEFRAGGSEIELIKNAFDAVW